MPPPDANDDALQKVRATKKFIQINANAVLAVIWRSALCEAGKAADRAGLKPITLCSLEHLAAYLRYRLAVAPNEQFTLGRDLRPLLELESDLGAALPTPQDTIKLILKLREAVQEDMGEL